MRLIASHGSIPRRQTFNSINLTCPNSSRIASTSISILHRPFSSSSPTSSSSSSFFNLPETVSNFISPMTPTLHNLPSILHLDILSTNHSHALSILALTFLLRSTITLPISLWSRSRTRRMVELLLPEWNKEKRELPVKVMKRCRRSGKNYEEYKAELTIELKQKMTQLISQYNCSPLPTFLLPLLIHLPLFLFLSSLIRQGCLPPTPFSTEFLPWSSLLTENNSAMWIEQSKILMEKGMDAETLSQLNGSGKGGDSLVEKDSSMMGPIGLGMITMLNVELGGYMRRFNAEKGGEEIGKKGEGDGKIEEKVQEESLRSKSITNVLRAFSIVFVPIAMQAPGALVVYWLSSATFTLFQNSIFTILDRRRALKLSSNMVAKKKPGEDVKRKFVSSSDFPR